MKDTANSEKDGGGTDQIGCHHPLCNNDADELAYDSITKINIGFCENHGRYWFRQDHIKRGGSA